MCVGKALSGGTMTLAATMASSRVARTISKDGGVFMHGPTFMGNPLACAVSNASLDILRQGTWKSQVLDLETWLDQAFAPVPGATGCRGCPGTRRHRRGGNGNPVNVPRLQQHFINRGVWLRPFGRLIYAMPPYIMTREETEAIGSAIHDAITTNIYA